MNAPLKLTGISLTPSHHSDILCKRPPLAWLELSSENYLIEGGITLHTLEKICCDYPISLHGKGLSLGSTDELNWQHLKKLKNLITKFEPVLISEQLGWSSLQGRYFHESLPLPYNQETVQHIVTRIQQIQDFLHRPILIGNIENYIVFTESNMFEWEFIKEIATKAGCGILLNLKNICLSAPYQQVDPWNYIINLPKELIQEIHLSNNHKEQWKIYQRTIQQMGIKPTIIENDDSSSDFNVLYKTALFAESIMREIYVARKLAG